MKPLSVLSTLRVIVLSITLVLLLGVVDALTGQEISFSVFYMLPIYLATRQAGRWPGVAIAILSALTWRAADYAAGHSFSHALIPFWNTLVRLSFFLLMAYLLSELQKNEQRRRSLERIFFHDILNLVGTVRGFAELLKDKEIDASQEVYEMIYQAADRSIEEIEAQRTLSNAENNEVYLELEAVDSKQFLVQVADMYRHHVAAKGKTIIVGAEHDSIVFESDPALLCRVLGNMLKNALEATVAGGQVIVGCRGEEGRICFWVHNDSVIPEEIRTGIFRRNVSSKGEDRGLGTYSMKKLSSVLAGQVSFASDALRGTVFTACYPLTFPARKKPAV